MKYMLVVCLVTTIFLHTACSNYSNENTNIQQPEITLKNVRDTLNFKTGIRSILQDSKGNYWFGSNQEGVCKYDGKKFTYYTPENGFCGKQVIYIKEDNTGLIWFGTSSGLCYFNGERFTAISFQKEYLTSNVFSKQYAA